MDFKTTAIRYPSASKSPEFARFPVRRHAEWPGVTGRVTVAEHAAVVEYLTDADASSHKDHRVRSLFGEWV